MTARGTTESEPLRREPIRVIDGERWVAAGRAAEAEAAERVARLRARVESLRASALTLVAPEPAAVTPEPAPMLGAAVEPSQDGIDEESVDLADILEDEAPPAVVSAAPSVEQKPRAAPPPVPVARVVPVAAPQVRRRPLPGLPPENPSVVRTASREGKRAQRSFTMAFRDVVETEAPAE